MVLPQNIIIVEDEVITQRYLKNILEQYDVNVTGCFDNASDTIEAMRRIECDMILMDINIKGSVDGIQLTRNILRMHDVPVIFITAHSDRETFQEVLDLSPYGFISKPFSARDIEVTLQLAYQRYLTYKKEKKIQTAQIVIDRICINERYTYSQTLNMLYCDEKPVKLNIKQNKLLKILSKNINNAVSYDELVMAVWGDASIADSALRTLVYSLRKLLPELPLQSYSKVGYSLVK